MQGKAPVGYLEKRSRPEAGAKYEISVQFLTSSSRTFRI